MCMWSLSFDHVLEKHELYSASKTSHPLQRILLGREQVAPTNGLTMGTGWPSSLRNGLAGKKSIPVMEVCPFQVTGSLAALPAGSSMLGYLKISASSHSPRMRVSGGEEGCF